MSPYGIFPGVHSVILILLITAVTALACNDLMDLINGGIAYDMKTIDNRPVNTVATYTCNTGYTLIGELTRTCGSDGVWSASSQVCQGWWLSCFTSITLS